MHNYFVSDFGKMYLDDGEELDVVRVSNMWTLLESQTCFRA